jgi:hypothetical protein
MKMPPRFHPRDIFATGVKAAQAGKSLFSPQNKHAGHEFFIHGRMEYT